MRLLLTAAVASLAIATAACNTKADDTLEANMADDMMINDMNAGMNTDMNTGMAGNDNMAMPMTAAAFVAAVAGTNMYEIEAGKLAQSMATMEECKKLGAMLVTDHTKSSVDLKAAAAAASPAVTVPTALPAEHQAHLDALKAAKGAEFDRLFLEQQKAGHQKALATLKSYAAGGDAPSLKAFASKAALAVEGHLAKLNAMKM